MSDTVTNIQVQTIYTAEHAPAGASSRLKVWGVVSLLVAGAWLYVVWWPVWDWAQAPLMIGTIGALPGMPASQPSPAVSDGQAGLNELSVLLGSDPIAPPSDGKDDPKQAASKSKAAASQRTTAADDANKPDSKAPSKSMQETGGDDAAGPTGAQAALVTGLIAWIIAPALLGLWIAMAGAASLGGPVIVRRAGLILALLALVSAGAAAWHIQKTTEWYESILPMWTKPVLVSLGGLFAVGIGLAMNRKALFLQRSGAVMVILSAGLTVAAFWSASRWGPSAEPTPLFYARVFGQQSAFGWITLIALWGLK